MLSLAQSMFHKDLVKQMNAEMNTSFQVANLYLFLKSFLSYNSHLKKFTLLKGRLHRLLVYLQGCAIITSIKFQNTSITPKWNPRTSHSPHFPAAQAPKTTNLSSIFMDGPILDISF